MIDPFHDQALLSRAEVAKLLGMDTRTFKRFLEEEPSFPKPIVLGKPKRRADRERWRKQDVLAWIALQPAVEAAGDEDADG